MNNYLKIVAWALFVLYLILIIKLILFKGSTEYILEHFNEKYSYELIEKRIKGANFYPFATIYYYLSGQETTSAAPNLLGNIILFLPLGFFLPILIKKNYKLKQVAFIALIISLCFETIQLLIAYGTFDIDDCILNCIGAVLGFLIFIKVKRTVYFKVE